MRNIEPNKKQKASPAKGYSVYLNKWPKPTDDLHNKRNLFDDLNSADKVAMKEVRNHIQVTNDTDTAPGQTRP